MLDRVTPPSVQNVPFAFRKPAKQVLRNGIPLYVIEGGGQEVVRVDFVFSVGQWHQNQKLQALFTCRMLREGCQGYSSTAFAEQLDYYGAWLELSVAMNRTFVTLYTLKILSTDGRPGSAYAVWAHILGGKATNHPGQ